MQIKIDGKKYNLNFGIKFVFLMNQAHHAQEKGINIGMGVNQVAFTLLQKDVVGLAEILENATWINKERPTLNQIYAYLDNPSTDIDKLFNQVSHEVTTANATKSAVKNLMKTMKNAQERAMKLSLEKSNSMA